MIDTISDLVNQYWDQIIAWYNSLGEVAQYGALGVLFVAILLIVVFFLLSRITR